MLCLARLPLISGSISTPFASSARPRKYLSPFGTAPRSLLGRRIWMYVSTMGEYWRSDCISACSCATILSTTSVSFGCCWGTAVRGSAPNAKATANIFKARIMPPKLYMRDLAGLCQSRPPTAPCKLYKGLVQGQEYLKTGSPGRNVSSLRENLEPATRPVSGIFFESRLTAPEPLLVAATFLCPAQNRRRRFLRPVQAHDQINGSVRRWQPVGFLRFPRRVFLDVESQRAIRISFSPGSIGGLIR